MKQLSKSEIKELNEKIAQYGISFDKKDSLTEREKPTDTVYKEGLPYLFLRDNKWIPTLYAAEKGLTIKTITVDQGAIPFLMKGADIMRPGIVGFDDGIERGTIIIVREQKHSKAIAVGKALVSSSEIGEMKTGKAVQNLHYVGDIIWTAKD